MNMPQKTPKAVNRLRVLFLVMVMNISSHLSKSILIILICSKCFDWSDHDGLTSRKEACQCTGYHQCHGCLYGYTDIYCGIEENCSVKTPASTVWFLPLYSCILWQRYLPPFLYTRKVVIVTLSAIISHKIDIGLAPNALRIPNSRVRSFTVISMILLTPTMPLSKVNMPITQMAIVRMRIPFFLLQELSETVPHPDSAFVISCKPVVYADSFAVLLFKDFSFFLLYRVLVS